jgi:hypothetical protein
MLSHAQSKNLGLSAALYAAAILEPVVAEKQA